MASIVTSFAALVSAAPPMKVTVDRNSPPKQWVHPAEFLAPEHGNKNQILIEPTAPVINLLERAEEGFLRRDWKFVIDSLQRIVDDPQDSLVPVVLDSPGGRRRYETVRRTAVRQIASLPPEGLRAYHLLYDGAARSMLQRAQRDHDIDTLQELVQRFPNTSAGPKAIDLLASWMLDEGRAAAALLLLDDLQQLHPDLSVDSGRIHLKRATAYTLMGEAQLARRLLQAVPPPDDPLIRSAFEEELFIKQIAEEAGYNRALPETQLSERVNFWSVSGGSPQRRGIMPGVTPTLHPANPWRYTFSGGGGRHWRPTVTDDPQDPIAVPPCQLCMANGAVFARTPDGVVALNADDLSLRWRADHPAHDPTKAGQIRIRGPLVDVDFVAWSIATSDDLVFVLDREAYTHPPDDVGRLRGNPSRLGNVTTLTAYHTQDGRLMWQRGHGRIPTDAMWDVDVRGLPIAVGGYLWVAAQRQRDLYLLKIHPRTGVLEDSTLLGMLPTPELHVWEEIELASDGRSIFVPSGWKTLFAVSVDDSELLWAIRFGSPAPSDATLSSSRPRSAPVVDNGRLFLASPDRSDVIAFSTADGSMLWTVPVGEYSYIVGAAQRRLWLAGRRVECLSQLDGQVLWSETIQQAPTGRAILSEEAVILPTWEGLIAYESGSGSARLLGKVSSQDSALGNLLTSDSALYSVEPSGVRMFADVAKQLPTALAAHRAAPSDPAKLNRVAWLELLSGSARQALTRLRSFPRIEESRDLFSNVEFESLIALARASSTGTDEAIALLERAVTIAPSSPDRLRAVASLADTLRAAGRLAEAYRHLLLFGLSAESSQYVLSDGFVQLSARREIAGQLRTLAANLPPAAMDFMKSALMQHVEDAGAEAISGLDKRSLEQRLHAVLDVGPWNAVFARALIDYALLCAKDSRFAQAGQLLSRLAREPNDSSLWDQIDFGDLRDIWDAYANYPAARSDAWPNILTRMVRDASDGAPVEWVKAALQTLHSSDSVDSAPGGASDDRLFALQGGFSWTPIKSSRTPQQRANRLRVRTSRNLRSSEDIATPVHFGAYVPPELSSQLICGGSGNELISRNVATGSIAWRVPLRLPGSFGDPPPEWYRPTSVVSADQTLAVQTPMGLFGIGIATGKRLWARPANNVESPDAPRIIGGRDWVAAVMAPGRLSCISMFDGATFWERDMRGEPVAQLRYARAYCDADASANTDAPAARDTVERVLTIDKQQQRLHILSAANGSLVKKIIFRQHDSDGTPINITVAGNVVCGPDSNTVDSDIVAYDVYDGSRLWERSTPKPAAQLFTPGEGMIGVTMLGGDILLLDAATGNIVYSFNVPHAGRISEGFFHRDNLILRYGPSANDPLRLAALNVRTGERLWIRTHLAPASKSDFPLEAVGCALPVATSISSHRSSGIGLVTLDLRTGEDADKVITLLSNAERLSQPVWLRVWPGVIIVSTTGSIHPFSFQPVEPTPSGES